MGKIADTILTDDEFECLAGLDGRTDWSRPMDVGGTDGSHHSRTLAKLFRRDLAERRDRGSLMGRRAVWLYRITPAGSAARIAHGSSLSRLAPTIDRKEN